MDKGVLSYLQMKPNVSLLDEIFTFDANNLEQTDGITLSKYAVALSQFLVYYKSQVNQTKVDIFKKQRVLDAGVTYSMTKELMKTYKTKTDATNAIIIENADLSRIREEIDSSKEELMLLEGIDKTIAEYIAMLKRELTRREYELHETRYGRKS